MLFSYSVCFVFHVQFIVYTFQVMTRDLIDICDVYYFDDGQKDFRIADCDFAEKLCISIHHNIGYRIILKRQIQQFHKDNYYGIELKQNCSLIVF